MPGIFQLRDKSYSSHSTSEDSESASQASEPSAMHVPQAQVTPIQNIPNDGRRRDATVAGLERSKKKEVWEDQFVSLAAFPSFRTWWPVRSLTLERQFR